jgi:23S rRNA pseudouridine2605 synthase
MTEQKKKIRLSKYLAAAGIASRRACEELIFAGHVKVNGSVVLVPQTGVDNTDTILCEGKKIEEYEPKVYYMLNKPAGYLCTAKKGPTDKIILDLFTDVPYRLFTVGRLDKYTQGLLLVTNDGHFANEVIHPSSSIDKEYIAKVDIEIDDTHLKAISGGAQVKGVFVKPIRVTKVRKGTIKIVIAEGKKREVRILLENAGLKVKELTRVRIGGLILGSLAVGEWRSMSERDKALVFEG